MIKPTRRSLAGAFVVLVATAMCLSGCPDETKPAGGDKPGVTGSASGGSAAPVPTSNKEFKIGWSVWTGWMPFKLMAEKGFLAKRAAENKVKVKLVEFKGYMDSVQAFAAKKLDGCAMTSMEALQPASNGVRSVGILINDRSNGGDGVLARGNATVKDLKGKTVLLEEFSVSHYLLNRALESAGLKEKDVKIKNIPGDEAGKAFLTDAKVQAVATWNPHLFHAVEANKGKVVFSSRDIPNEIMDFLIMNETALKEAPGLGKALTDAWFDAMAYITDNELDPPGAPQTTYAEWVDFCHGVDLLIHDAQYEESDMPAKHGWGHSLISQVRQLAVDAEIKNIVMYHHDPERTDAQLDEIATESARYFKAHTSKIGSYIAAEGLSFELAARKDPLVTTVDLSQF